MLIIKINKVIYKKQRERETKFHQVKCFCIGGDVVVCGGVVVRDDVKTKHE